MIISPGVHGAIGTVVVGGLVAGLPVAASAQCDARWLPETPTERVEGAGNRIVKMTMWDSDGDGPLPPKLVIVGSFTTAGGVAAANIASWDGYQWEQIGGGTNGWLSAVAVLSDGRLVVAGYFSLAGNVPVSNIAAWDGNQWSTLGEGLSGSPPLIYFQVNALCADANGGVYAAGGFTNAGGSAASNIAYWNGDAWTTLSSGLSGAPGEHPWVSSLLMLPSGELLAGGMFTNASGTAVKSLAKWNGTVWSDVGGGVNGTIWCIGRAASGSIFVGGDFSVLTAPFQSASSIAEWNGTKWNRVGSGVNGPGGGTGIVRDVVFLPNGDLIAGGTLTLAGSSPASSIARWNGSMWSQLGSGLPSAVQSMFLHPSGELLVGRDTTMSSNKTKVLSRWAGGASTWIAEQPQSASAQCGGSIAFESRLSTGYDVTGASWFRGEEQLSHNPAAGIRVEISGRSCVLRFDNVSPAIAGAYRCVFSTACTNVESETAVFVVTGTCCVADFNLDGEVNDVDFEQFVVAYNILACDDELMTPGCPADLNRDGMVDDADFQAFVVAYDQLVCS